MAAYMQALERGGYATHGQSWYDPRANVLMVQAADGEILPITVSFPSAINTINYELDGVATTEPSISSATFTATLSNFNAGDKVRYDVLLSSGEMRNVNIEIAGASVRGSIISAGGDYGTFS